MASPTPSAAPTRLLTDAEWCEMAGITRGQSAQMRHLGTGPKFVKLTGHQIRYRLESIEEWIESRTKSRTGKDRG